MNARTAHAARTALLGRMGSDSSCYWTDLSSIRESVRNDQHGVVGLESFSPCRSAPSPEFALLKAWTTMVETFRQITLSGVDGFHVPPTPVVDKQVIKVDVIFGDHCELHRLYERSLHIESFVSAFGAHIDYSKAYARLNDFLEEEEDWDGFGGRPASLDTAAAVKLFLQAASAKSIVRPSLTLSNSGAVSAVWKHKRNYVTVTFKGPEKYVATVTSEGASKLAVEGAAGMLPNVLEQYLLENFKDDARHYL